MGLLLPALRSQTARPQFDVASLKPNPGCENNRRGGNLSPSPGRLEMPCVTLQGLIQSAYGRRGTLAPGSPFEIARAELAALGIVLSAVPECTASIFGKGILDTAA